MRSTTPRPAAWYTPARLLNRKHGIVAHLLTTALQQDRITNLEDKLDQVLERLLYVETYFARGPINSH